MGNPKGFYQNINGKKFIFLNSKLDYYDNRIVCAPELGHALLHKSNNTQFFKNNTFFCTDKFERQANIFAVNLLLPDDFIEDFKKITIEQITVATGYY